VDNPLNKPHMNIARAVCGALLAAASGAGAIASGCAAIAGSTPVPVLDGSTLEGGALEGGAIDARSDAAEPRDARHDVRDARTATVYSALDDRSKWSFYDLGGIGSVGFGFVGGSFDGRYVYMSPWAEGSVTTPFGMALQYDTHASFESSKSWTFFDLTKLNPQATGYQGGAFDGRFAYFTPSDPSGHGSFVAQLDTKDSFTVDSSWSLFDTTSLDGGPSHYASGVYDGKYVYFAPNLASGAPLVLRYDTVESFGDGTSWSTFDVATTVTGRTVAFAGGVFDGRRYVYLVPGNVGAGYVLTLRYDTTGAFGDDASWDSFNLVNVVPQRDAGGPQAGRFAGGIFDGRYVYFVPGSNSTAPNGLVMRYDTTTAFASTKSWSTFETSTLSAAAQSFINGGFDGRYVYFVPAGGANDAVATRYDSEAPFDDAASWSTFDLTLDYVDGGSGGGGRLAFGGAVFDGQFMYFVPVGQAGSGTIVARFDAKTPSSLPPGYAHGSFF
jgi:hypothetical protein